jgi:hypothetical protein
MAIEIFKIYGADGWTEKYEEELAALLFKKYPSHNIFWFR